MMTIRRKGAPVVLLCACLLAFAACTPKDAALMDGIRNREVGTVERLLAAGAPVNAVPQGDHQLPLELAAQQGEPRIVKMLLDHGAPPDSAVDAPSPLWAALMNGHAEAAIALVKGGANVNRPRAEEMTPFYFAVLRDYDALAEAMLAQGADVRGRGPRGTPLHEAVHNANSGAVRLLLAHEADPNAQNRFGETPLFEAFGGEGLEIAGMLAEAGADPDIQNRLGESVLFGRVRDGKAAAAEQVIAWGADVNLRNAEGETPLHIAAETGQTDMAVMLLDAGADPNIRSHSGATTAMLAYRMGHKEILDLLTKEGARLR